MQYLLFAIVFFCFQPSPMLARQESKLTTGPKLSREQFNRILAQSRQKQEAMLDSMASFNMMQLLLVPDNALDDTARTLLATARRANYRYMNFAVDHRMKVFKWQHLSTQITFFVVILLVSAGIVFSGIQFYIGMKERLQTKAAKSEEPVTEIEASAAGIKVSSPVLGVIILVISLAFFYLYLAFVYPIRETF